MAHYRSVGQVPPKRHTQHRTPTGALYREELMGEEGFSSDSSLLYHVGVPSAIVAATPWELPDQTTTENRPLIPRHNTFLDQVTGDRGETAAVYATDDFGPLSNVTIDNNWMAGGAYALYAGSRAGNNATNIHVTNNYFSTVYFPNSGFYGPLGAYDPNGAGNTFVTNVFADGPNAGQLITP